METVLHWGLLGGGKDKSEEQPSTEVSVRRLLDFRVDKVNNDRQSGPAASHTSITNELRYEIAELLTVACNPLLKLAPVPKE